MSNTGLILDLYDTDRREEFLDQIVLFVVERRSAETRDPERAVERVAVVVRVLPGPLPGLDDAVMAHSAKSPKANELRRDGMAALQREGLTLDEAHNVYRAVTWLWLGSRVALEGRPRRQADIDTFAESLDILVSGLKNHLSRKVSAS